MLPTRLLIAYDIPSPTEYSIEDKFPNMLFDASSMTPIVPTNSPKVQKLHLSIHVMNADGAPYLMNSHHPLKLSLLKKCHDSSGNRSGVIVM